MPLFRSINVAALYDTHAGEVWKALHRFGVRRDDAPDLLQEVFVVVHRRRRAIDGSRPIEPLLWAITLGLVRNYRRRAFRRLESLCDPVDLDHASTGPDDIDRLELRRRLIQALERLEPESQEVFVMFELEGLSGHAIGELLEIPVGTVHSRLHTARRELRVLLTRDEQPTARTAIDLSTSRSR
ncbi:MAG: RNA polymerase sigma factor [Kofleriaceae bacterium]